MAVTVWLKRQWKWLLAAASLGLVIPMGFILGTWRQAPAPRGDLAVVLGAMVHADGTPSQILSGRLNLAKKLYREKRIQSILVSGGKPRNKTGEDEEMKRWLMSKGVPSFRILVDPEGVDTWQTALNTRRIMTRKGYRRAVIVTSYYHLARTRLAFERAGVPVSGLAGATEGHGSFGEPFRVLREVPALYGYWLFKARQ